MKKTILLSIAFILTLSVYAQRRQPQARRHEINPEQMALTQTQQLHEALQLDSIQFQTIFLMNYSDAMALKDSMKVREERMKKGEERPSAPTEDERRARSEIMKKRMEVRDEQMKKILSSEQYEKYLEYNEKINKNRQQGRHPRGERNNRQE